MINMLEKIINETSNDNQLFARYGFKFYNDIEKDKEQSLFYLKKKPNFKNEFQLVFMSGLLEHFYKNDKPDWVTNEKLESPWGYMSGFDINDQSYEINNNSFLPEMTKRGIYAI